MTKSSTPLLKHLLRQKPNPTLHSSTTCPRWERILNFQLPTLHFHLLQPTNQTIPSHYFTDPSQWDVPWDEGPIETRVLQLRWLPKQGEKSSILWPFLAIFLPHPRPLYPLHLLTFFNACFWAAHGCKLVFKYFNSHCSTGSNFRLVRLLGLKLLTVYKYNSIIWCDWERERVERGDPERVTDVFFIAGTTQQEKGFFWQESFLFFIMVCISVVFTFLLNW